MPTSRCLFSAGIEAPNGFWKWVISQQALIGYCSKASSNASRSMPSCGWVAIATAFNRSRSSACNAP
ncbi:hypothetical protein D3C76_1716060 [compost metagenome]